MGSEFRLASGPPGSLAEVDPVGQCCVVAEAAATNSAMAFDHRVRSNKSASCRPTLTGRCSFFGALQSRQLGSTTTPKRDWVYE